MTEDEIATIINNEVIKREVLDSDESGKAKKDISKAYKKLEKEKVKLKPANQEFSELSKSDIDDSDKVA
jgi:hypothetical protein